MQFIEIIFLLQSLKMEIATAKELDLRPLGKVIIFRDKQTNRQNLPIKHALFWPLPAKVKNDLKKYLLQISKVSLISVETANGRIMFHVLAKLV